jgi:hypothetical protein
MAVLKAKTAQLAPNKPKELRQHEKSIEKCYQALIGVPAKARTSPIDTINKNAYSR